MMCLETRSNLRWRVPSDCAIVVLEMLVGLLEEVEEVDSVVVEVLPAVDSSS